jgi:hypothetical protein
MLVAALALIECGMRVSDSNYTRDFQRYREFPELARQLAKASQPRVALVGNSVMDRVQPHVLQGTWKELTGFPLSTEKFIAYNSNLTTWHWMSQKYFWDAGIRPDLLIITYYEGNTLADSKSQDVGNLALFFTDPDDRQALFTYDLTSLGQRLEYLLSSISQAYAARDRLRDRTLVQIPGYRPFRTKTNALNYEFEQRRKDPVVQGTPTFTTLARFLAAAKRANVKVCFVASPSRPDGNGSSYIISPTARAMIAEAGMLHLDLRNLDGLSAAMYEDNVHLNALGQPVYTRKLAHELSKVWRPS